MIIGYLIERIDLTAHKFIAHISSMKLETNGSRM